MCGFEINLRMEYSSRMHKYRAVKHIQKYRNIVGKLKIAVMESLGLNDAKW